MILQKRYVAPDADVIKVVSQNLLDAVSIDDPEKEVVDTTDPVDGKEGEEGAAKIGFWED